MLTYSLKIIKSLLSGRQGGAVVRKLINYPEKYFVRVLSRDPSQTRALNLTKYGVKVVKGDLRDETTLPQAPKGAYGAFAVTNYHAQNVKATRQSNMTELRIAVAEAAKVSLQLNSLARAIDQVWANDGSIVCRSQVLCVFNITIFLFDLEGKIYSIEEFWDEASSYVAY